jgi:hypothetical protein
MQDIKVNLVRLDGVEDTQQDIARVHVSVHVGHLSAHVSVRVEFG